MLTVNTALFRAHRSSVNRSLSDAPTRPISASEVVLLRSPSSSPSPPPFIDIISVDLVEELSAGVLAEQGFSDSRCGSFLKELQPSLESIVDIDLAAAADDDDTSGSAMINS